MKVFVILKDSTEKYVEFVEFHESKGREIVRNVLPIFQHTITPS